MIRSLATYVPPRVLTNADLEKMSRRPTMDPAATGIRERHIVEPGVALDLGNEASVKARTMLG